MQVFVSFTGKDREIKNQVVERLRQELDKNDTVWESDEGCASDYSEESIREIRKSAVYVILLSGNSMDPASYVFNELIEARQCENRGALNMIIFKLDDVPLTERFILQLNHISDANHVGRIYQNTEAGLDSLVKKVKYLLQCRKLGRPEKPLDVFMPELNGVPLGDIGYFVPHSRDTLLMEMDEALKRANIVFFFQIPGYGRRTAAYKYAEFRRDQYDHILFFPQFSGSVRDFFLTFLTIRNINDAIYEKMNEVEVIRKKVELLNKLGPRTLLVIPNLIPEQEDDTDLFRLFSDLECRMIFITQSVPLRLQDSFPVVNVGRMDDNYLLTLFFHYYDLGDDVSKQELEQSLRSFFQSVGGHTKTVEIAANVLEDEYVFPEDAPALIERICSFDEDELSERIYRLVSDLFDMKRFDETDRKILLAAALIADIGIPEKEFVRILRDAGVFSGPKLNRIIELCWIDRDSETRTLSMSAVLCNVCIAKIPLDEAVINSCVKSISSELWPMFVSGDPKGCFRLLRSLQRLWQLQDYSGCVALTEQALHFLSDGNFRIGSEKLTELEKNTAREVAGMSESVRQDCDDIIQSLVSVLRMTRAIDELALRGGNEALDDAVFSVILNSGGFQESLSAIAELMEGYQDEVSESLRDILVCHSIHEAVPKYLFIINHIVSDMKENDEDNNNDDDLAKADVEETFFMMIVLLNAVGLRLSQLLSNVPYIKLQVLQSREKLIDCIDFIYSAKDYYLLQKDMMETKAAMDGDPEEIAEAYGTALSTLQDYGSEIFAEDQELEDAIINLHQSYINIAIDAALLQEAASVCRELWELPVRTAESFRNQTDIIEKVGNAFLAEGRMEEALLFLEDALPRVKTMLRENFRQETTAAEAWDELESMEEVLQVLKNPDSSGGFTDSADEYLDYYKTYGSGNNNRGLLKKYTAIADAALKLDYSECSDEELLTIKKRLVQQAEHNENWENLAPKAFALVSEAGSRVLGYHLHYVQIIGAAAIFDGNAAEMLNGEGKTFTVAAAAFLHVLYKRQVHIMDLSNYLCRRNFVWMRSLFEFLECRSGFVSSDFVSKEYSNFERKLADLNESDVIYGCFSDMAFIYLHQEKGDEIYCKYPLRRDVAIVDEGDQIFFNGTGMLQIVGQSSEISDKKFYQLAYDLISGTDPEEDYYFVMKNRRVTLRPPLYKLAEKRLGKSMAELSSMEVNTFEEALREAVIALYDYQKDKDYFIQADSRGRTSIVYENEQGELVPYPNSWAYFLWKKEGRNIESLLVDLSKKRIYSSISIYSFLKIYKILSGASATFSSLKGGLRDYYHLPVFFVPPNLPVIRRDEAPVVYIRQESKYTAIVNLTKKKHETGQPVLIICQNVPESRMVSALLTKADVEHTLFNAINEDQNPDCLLYAGELNKVTVTTAIANRGVDICLGGNPSAYAKKDLIHEGVSAEKLDEANAGISVSDPELAVLRKRYAFLCALYWHRFQSKKEAVEKLGGLCVIGTTCFNDLRTEQQMRGRAGRQGSPGESHVYYSFDDKTLKELLGNLYELYSRMLSESEDEGINMSILDRAILHARLKVQRNSFLSPDQTPDALYYSQARKLLLGSINEVRKPGFDFASFWTDHFRADSRYQKDLEKYVNQGKTRSASFIAALADDNTLTPERVPKHFKPRLLADILLQKLSYIKDDISAHFEEYAKRITVGELQEAWSLYLESMETEAANVKRIIPQEGKQKKHLKEFSEREAQRRYDDAVEKALVRLYRIGLRYRADTFGN